MKRRNLGVAVVSATTALAVLGTALPASASSDSQTDNVKKNAYTYGTSGYTITVGGTNVYYKKTDGPEVYVAYYKCGVKSNVGSNVLFQNPDPTPRQLLGTDFLAKTTFCLRFNSQGNNDTDTVTGTSYWNVNS